VLAGYKKELGARHPDTLTSMSNLAHLLKKTGEYAEAILLMESYAKGRKQALGIDHLLTTNSETTLTRWYSERVIG
jgi:hypothetical protein